jgi:hypothetical protein
MLVCHLSGELTKGKGTVRVEPARAVPGKQLSEMSWVRALGGFMTPSGPTRFRFVRSSPERLAREIEAGALYIVNGGEGCMLLSSPFKQTWSDRIVRGFVPLDGKLDMLMDAATQVIGGDGSRADGFMPIDLDAISLAGERGWTPGAIWGMRAFLCERPLY